jgi:hypothetical protein
MVAVVERLGLHYELICVSQIIWDSQGTFGKLVYDAEFYVETWWERGRSALAEPIFAPNITRNKYLKPRTSLPSSLTGCFIDLGGDGCPMLIFVLPLGCANHQNGLDCAVFNLVSSLMGIILWSTNCPHRHVYRSWVAICSLALTIWSEITLLFILISPVYCGNILNLVGIFTGAFVFKRITPKFLPFGE